MPVSNCGYSWFGSNFSNHQQTVTVYKRDFLLRICFYLVLKAETTPWWLIQPVLPKCLNFWKFL